jgi:AAA+ ATPase superfamily predicted ATPase
MGGFMARISQDFFDRKSEMASLSGKFSSSAKGEMVVLYGRRRLGKTLLIKKFMDAHPAAKSLYLFVNLQEEGELKGTFCQNVKEQTGQTLKIEAWQDFFGWLHNFSAKEKAIVVIDEFQRLKNIAPSFISSLQDAWDSTLKNDRLFLVLVGSSIGMMSKIALSGAGALYGRKTYQMRLEPFRYADFREMFPAIFEEERVQRYAVFGGTPYYLELSKKHQSLKDAIVKEVLEKDAPLREEPKDLLEFELRTIARYNSILHAIASGKQTNKEISDMTGIAQQSLPPYLNTLSSLMGLVEKKEPMFGKKNMGRYRLRDNFFKFWYSFLHQNNTLLELSETAMVMEKIEEQLPAFTGRAFEGVVLELLAICNRKEIKGLKLDFERIGSWWDKAGNEIDICIPNKNELLLGEVKWASKPVGPDLLHSLEEKSKLVNHPGKRRFILVSKSGFTEGCLKLARETGTITLDLKDIQALFDSKR